MTLATAGLGRLTGRPKTGGPVSGYAKQRLRTQWLPARGAAGGFILGRSFGEVEVVTRDRYALFRTTRIFPDLTVRDALRVVVHLGRKVSAAYFIKTGPSGNRVSHVMLVRTAEDLRTMMPFLGERSTYP
jgi:hypothetical protein